jgi:DNA adenine methylase
VTARLKGCIIEHKDALEVIRQQDGAATLFYVDPPYLHSTRNCRTKNQYLFEFTHYQHEALLAMLGRVKGKVILSGYDSPLYHDHLAGWRVEKKSVQAQSQKGSCQRIEFLWMNF